jgi:hypothetical protein
VNLTRTRRTRADGDPARSQPGRARPRAPRLEERLAAQRRARDRSLLRDGIVLLVVIAAVASMWPLRLVENEDYPAGQALVERFDALFVQIRSGLELGSTPTEVAPGIQGALVEVANETRWVLTGAAGRDCYALWWDQEGVRRGRTLPTTMPCEPSSSVTSPRPQHFERIGRAVRETDGPYDWAPVLPDPVRYRFWFLPAVILGGGLGLAAVVRITIALLTGNAPSATRR